MNHKELITLLSKELGWSATETSGMLAAFTSVVGECLTGNDVINIKGFGQFGIKKRGERINVNPASGKRYLIPPKLVPVFKPGASLKDKAKNITDHE